MLQVGGDGDPSGLGTDDTAARPVVTSGSAIGKKLDGGRFEIVRELAQGGMGRVYVAIDHQFGVEVAVKVLSLSQQGPAREELERRFLSEARVLGRLKEPRILKPLAYGRMDSGELYLVSELLEGAPLDAELERVGMLGQERTLHLLIDACRGLGEAHAHGVIHRDLKPGNLFLQLGRSGDETARILDFGIAKVTSTDSALQMGAGPKTRPGMVMGTVPYMAPEQALGEAVGPQTDLYSLGVVAYHCLTGEVPFKGEPAQVLLSHVSKEPPPMGQVRPGLQIEPEFEELVLQMLAKSPADRPLDARSVRERCQRLLGAASHDLPSPPSSDPHWRQPADAEPAGANPMVHPPTDVDDEPVSRPRPGWLAYSGVIAGGLLLAGAGLWAFWVKEPDVGPARPAPSKGARGTGPASSDTKGAGPPDVEPHPDPEPAQPEAEKGAAAREAADDRARARPTPRGPERRPETQTLRVALRPHGLRQSPANDANLRRLRRRATGCYRETGLGSSATVMVKADGSLRASLVDPNAKALERCMNEAFETLTLSRSGPVARVRVTVTRKR